MAERRQPAAGMVVVAESGEGKLSQAVLAGRHVLRADEPEALGGADLGPDPYAYLLASLGACTSMTLRMYAERKGWNLTHVMVHLRHGRVHAEDCRSCEAATGLVDVIVREVELEGDLTEEQRRRLLEIADKCPVHRTLTGQMRIATGLVGRAGPPTGGEE